MTLRTDYCGQLAAGDVGRSVSVCGWVASRREHGEHLAFIDLRDHTGVVQCVVDGAHDLRAEYVLRITGTVRHRPEGTVNPNLSTGEIEVHDCSVEVLNAAEPTFVDQDDVIAFISEAVAAATEAATGERPATMPSITWEEAAERYGSDKPDVRFGMELVELTHIFTGTEAKAFQAPCIKGILVEGQADIARNKLDSLTDTAKQFGAKGLAWFRVRDTELEGQLTKFLSEDEQTKLREAMASTPAALILAVADGRPSVRPVPRRLRLALAPPPAYAGRL